MRVLLFFLFDFILCLGSNANNFLLPHTQIIQAERQENPSLDLEIQNEDGPPNGTIPDTINNLNDNLFNETKEDNSLFNKWIEENSSLLTFLGVIITIIGIILAVFEVTIKTNRKWRKRIINSIPTDFDGHYIPSDFFVQPYFVDKGNTDCNDELLIEGNVEPRELLSFFIKKVFVENSKEDKVYLLLGETGMGKTTALVHLYIEYINNHTEKNLPHEIRILSLRRKECIDDISKIENPSNCILLLDALDENPQANDNNQEIKTRFDEEINIICGKFKYVVITCRPQYFKDDKTEKENFHVQRGNRWFNATRLMLCPFTPKQVQSYIDHEFKANEKELKKRAEKLINENGEILDRPLVLSYIYGIVNNISRGSFINNSLDVYDAIVHHLIIHDLEKKDNRNSEEKVNQWWQATSEIAGYIYRNCLVESGIGDAEIIEALNGNRGLTDVLREYLEIIGGGRLNEEKFDAETISSFRKRSLLTRRGEKYYFTHKSFYEYFMAYRLFYNQDTINSSIDTDFTTELINNLLDAYCNKRPSRFSDFPSISLLDIGELYLTKSLGDNGAITIGRVLELFDNLPENLPEDYSFMKARLLDCSVFYYGDVSMGKIIESTEIYRKLLQKDPVIYKDKLSYNLNYLGYRYEEQCLYKEASMAFQELLDIYLKEDGRGYFRGIDIAETYSALANVHYLDRHKYLAKYEYNKSLSLFQDIYNSSREFYDYESYIYALNGSALVNEEIHKYEEAYKDLKMAVDLIAQLDLRCEDGELWPVVAKTYVNYADLQLIYKYYKSAEEDYRIALSYYREYSDYGYENELLEVLRKMTTLYINMNHYDNAESFAKDYLSRLHQISEKDRGDDYKDCVLSAEKMLSKIHEQKRKER